MTRMTGPDCAVTSLVYTGIFASKVDQSIQVSTREQAKSGVWSHRTTNTFSISTDGDIVWCHLLLKEKSERI